MLARTCHWLRFNLARCAAGLGLLLPALQGCAVHAPQPEPGLCEFRTGSLVHGARNFRQLALTFDACPTSQTPAFDEGLYRWLKQSGTPATVFISGAWARANRDSALALSQLPHVEIALHGEHHPRLHGLSTLNVSREISDGAGTLQSLGISAIKVFRPPYWDEPETLPEALRLSDVQGLLGDVALGDPSPTRTAEIMGQDAVRWLRSGSVLLLHINGRGHHTLELLDQLVPTMSQRGYTWVKASQMLEECTSTRNERPLTGHTSMSNTTEQWDWGSSIRSAQVPFFKFYTGKPIPQVNVYNPLSDSFTIEAQQVRVMDNTLEFEYLHPYMHRMAQCRLTRNESQRLSGTCTGEYQINQWGAMQVDLWRAEPNLSEPTLLNRHQKGENSLTSLAKQNASR